MASTYSPALRLELMATGDQSGTWGDTTNTNLGTLLEQAITGYLSVAQGDVANLTLTTTNGASDQARNAVVRVTGALTATRNVVIQTANKLYTIANDTTGGFSIVVKTSAGTGVSVPPGAMMNIYSDGTNAVMGQNYWNGSIGGAVYLDAGAAVGPNFDLFRDSTSPAISDILGRVTFNGRDSAANKQEYASIETVIVDPTSTSEDGSLEFYVTVAGTRTRHLSLSAALASVTGALTASGLGTFAGVTLSGTNQLNLGAGGQVVFPATQNASSNVNTLDDYEEGTWTPVLTFVTAGDLSVAYASRVGTYTKIGNIVSATVDISTSTFTHTTASGNLRVTGLPFTAKTLTGYQAFGAGSVAGYTKAGYTAVAPRASSNTSFLDFLAQGTGVALAALSTGDMPTGGTVVIAYTIEYEAPT